LVSGGDQKNNPKYFIFIFIREITILNILREAIVIKYII